MMKKSLVALAALAVAGIASAQSSVTLFGVVDAGISYYDAKTNIPGGGSVKQSQWAQTSSGDYSSRLGFRGTEDLGGGLAASFWVEAGLASNTGAAGGRAGLGGSVTNATTGVVSPEAGNVLFNRRSTVSLSGAFGEVRIGRDYTSSFWNDTIFDPFGANGVGANLASFVGPADLNYVRTSNSVGYFTPSNLGGFYGQVQYGLAGQIKTSGSDQSNAGRYIGGRVGYANGPLDVAVAYGQSTTNDTVGVSRTNVKRGNLGASYDFGPIKAFGEYSQTKLDLAIFPASGTASVNDFLLGLTVPVGPGLIRASFSAAQLKADGVDPKPKANKFALGYVHNLSKRTSLYATYAHVTDKNGYAITTGGAPTFAAGGIPSSANGYDFGIRHAF